MKDSRLLNRLTQHTGVQLAVTRERSDPARDPAPTVSDLYVD
jgi:hypothetical protein